MPHTQLGSYCVNNARIYDLVCDWLRTRKSDNQKYLHYLSAPTYLDTTKNMQYIVGAIDFCTCEHYAFGKLLILKIIAGIA